MDPRFVAGVGRQQVLRFDGVTGAQFDQRDGPGGLADIGGVSLEDPRLRTRRVVLGLTRDVLEQPASFRVVEEAAMQPSRPVGEARDHGARERLNRVAGTRSLDDEVTRVDGLLEASWETGHWIRKIGCGAA